MKIFKLFFFSLFTFLFLRFAFVLKELDCRAESIHLEAGLCQKIENEWKNKSIFFTDFFNSNIWSELALNEEYGQSYQLKSLRRVLPNKIEIELTSRLPNYRLSLGDRNYLLAQSNILKKDQAELKVITIETNLSEEILDRNYLAESYHQKFSSLAQAISQNEIVVKRILWKDKTEIILFLENSLEVTLDEDEDFFYQMERLSIILNDSSLKNTLMEKDQLDLRFKLPVLKD